MARSFHRRPYPCNLLVATADPLGVVPHTLQCDPMHQDEWDVIENTCGAPAEALESRALRVAPDRMARLDPCV